MHETGLIASRDETRQRNTVRRMIFNKRRSVIHLLTDSLLSHITGPTVPSGPDPRDSAATPTPIASGQVHIADAKTGTKPEDAGNWGWRCRRYPSGGVEQEEWQPRGSLAGWLDGDDLLLEPEAVYAAVQRLARDQGNVFAITATTLWKRMHETGLIASRDETRQRNTVRRMIFNKRRSVIHLLTDSLLSHITGPTVPSGPDPRDSAPLRAGNLGRFPGDGEKPAHESGPKAQENSGNGPDGTVGPEMEHRGLPPDDTLQDDPEERAAIQEWDA